LVGTLQLGGHDGAHVDRLIERLADTQGLHARAQFRDQPVVNALLHEEA
jgi:hypothetical protein